jgi:RNA polymerase sigma factor FliA
MEDAMATVLASAEETTELWTRYHADTGNPALRNQLVERYLPLVKFHGERLWSRLPEGVELDDLISAGVFGLMDAIDAFDPLRGVRFETYCVTRIRGAMLDELRSMDWVPRLVRSKTAKLNEATKQLENKLGRSPTDLELAAQLQISQQELDSMKLESNTVNLVSLDKKFADDDSNRAVSELDVLDDRRSEDPTRRAQKNDLLRLVTRGLSRVERLILILYYYEEMTMKEVGATLDLSESRVSQMHSSLMQRLQEQLAPRRPELAAE